MDFNITQGDKTGNTALHYAAAAGNVSLVRLVVGTLQRYGMSVDKVNHRGESALIQAWRAGQPHAAEVLMEHGACDEVKDEVKGMTADQWREEYYSNVSKDNKRPHTGHHARRVHSGNSLTRRLTRQTTPPSVLLKRRRGTLPKSAWAGDEPDQQDELSFMKTCLSRRIIKSASATDLHNRPDYLLQISPVEYFSQQHHYQHPEQHHTDTMVPPGHHSMVPPGAPGEVEGHSASPGAPGGINTLFSAFEFQYTDSYRLPAKPLPEGYQYMCLGAPRSISPNPSDCPSEAISDRASVSSRMSRRSNQAQKLQRAVRNRRPSLLGPKLSHSDSSSNESVNATNKTKKRTPSASGSEKVKVMEECVEVFKDAGKVSPKGRVKSAGTRKPSVTSSPEVTPATGEGAGRPTSRQGHHVVPLVVEPTGDALLDAIQE